MKKFILLLLLISCKHNPYRDKLYRIRPINGNEVELRWMDSAYKAGDIISFATACNKSIVNATYIVIEQAK